MDANSAIQHLAHAEARRFRPAYCEEDLRAAAGDGDGDGIALPYVHVRRDAHGRLVAEGHGHRGHDNEGRMGFLCEWLQRAVLPFAEGDVTGMYRVELHDSYSYLPGARAYKDALVFSRPRAARESVALLPDPYQAAGYGGLAAAAAADPVPWDRKRPVVFFAGTTTGDRDPAKNERIRACVWSLSRPADEVFMRITNVAQMTPEACRAAVPRFDQVLHRPISLPEHFDFRYQLNIAGNTCCWSRVPMILASGSLMMHLKTHADIAWYYPLMHEDEHYVGVGSIAEVPACRARCLAEDAWAREVAARGRRFRASYLTAGAAALYAAQLLGEASWLTRP